MSEYGNRDRNTRKKQNSRRGYRFKHKRTSWRGIVQPVFLGIFSMVMIGLLVSAVSRGRSKNLIQDAIAGEMVMDTGSLSGSKPDKGERVTMVSMAEDKAPDVSVDHISITGLTKEEAKKKLLDAYPWDLKLTYGEETVALNNPLSKKLDGLLDQIYTGNGETAQYQLDVSDLDSIMKKQVEDAAAKWNKKPRESQLTGRDKENNRWIYSEGENGIRINQEKAVRDVMGLLLNKTFQGSVPVEADKTAPKLTAAKVKEEYKVIGAYATTTTKNENRNNNIKLAMDTLDGLVIYPGEEFSFNKTTGNRTIERGYKPAGAYRDGKFVEEPGGGVCQVSSTLYNAIIFSGIKTTERNPHSFEPSYVIPGEDSMVSYDGYSGPDLRFVNQQDTSVAIRAVFDGEKLNISIIGRPILEKGVEVSMRSEKIKEYDPPEPTYEEDQTLQLGQEVEVTKAVKGTTWKTYLVTKKDGKVMEDHYFHSSTYRGKAGVIRRNTSGVVIPDQTQATTKNPVLPTESESPPETEAVQETQAIQETNQNKETIVPNQSHEQEQAAQNQEEEVETAEIGPGIG